jgi:DNA mismatch repair protein MutS
MFLSLLPYFCATHRQDNPYNAFFQGERMAAGMIQLQAKLTTEPLAAPTPDEAATPLMAQYLAIKARHPNALLFFRLGDFYELFFEDAVHASKALDITLTRRGQMNGQDIPMCGVPFHAYEGYMARLIRQGFHVAICEQTEDPAEAKKRGGKSIVNRDVVRIVTPGTVTEDSLLEARAANILACVSKIRNDYAVAWIDLASAQPMTEKTDAAGVSACLARLSPSEILISDKTTEEPELFETLAQWRDRLSVLPAGRFNTENAVERLRTLYGTTDLTVFGDFSHANISALGTLIDYILLTQKCDLSHFDKPRLVSESPYMLMDPSTRRNLEITQTLAGQKQGSLISVIDRTQTSAGGRLLASRLNAPLADAIQINERLRSVDFFVSRATLRNDLIRELSHIPDLERALARLALSRGGPRDVSAIATTISRAEVIRSLLLATPEHRDCPNIKEAAQGLGQFASLIERLEKALAEDLPLLARDGGFIARGFSPQLDELLKLRDNSRQLIANLQTTYAQESGVSALKIKHNQVIGYYIEVTGAHAQKLFDRKDIFIHRQSMASAARFTTVELSELERKITEAAGKALAVELAIYEDLVKDVMALLPDLRRCAGSLAILDVDTALADLAVTNNLVKPVVDDSKAFAITKGRHIVVEQALKTASTPSAFMGNNCDLGDATRLWLLTGPNMAGKSTFLRQNALIAILAQAGSFVPAEHAHIGLVTRLFSRVGAADDLARGQSTFMVEMVETATILKQADDRSLVILDEIGRGTATYDGLSIAWATLEHLHDVNLARTLFATHYHELTQLAGRLNHLTCATMKIKEWKNEVIFLHEVVAGTADRSYGIHVAQMAGLPRAVISRADEILKHLESGSTQKNVSTVDNLPLFAHHLAESKRTPQESPILTEIQSLNPDDLTPHEALDLLYKLKKMTKG